MHFEFDDYGHLLLRRVTVTRCAVFASSRYLIFIRPLNPVLY